MLKKPTAPVLDDQPDAINDDTFAGHGYAVEASLHNPDHTHLRRNQHS